MVSNMYGFYRVAAVSPKIRVADVSFNVDNIISSAKEAEACGAAAVVFPELAITGYTCADLFFQDTLLNAAQKNLVKIAEALASSSMVIIVGAPLRWNNALFNCGCVLQGGQIRGVVPKIFHPNYREFYEKRWFKPGGNVKQAFITLPGRSEQISFGSDLIFDAGNNFKFGLEICEDLWNVIPPSCHQTIAGTLLTFNLSASNELVAKAGYRRSLVTQQSARCQGGYVYASSGVHESTTDLVFGGHSIIAENGLVVAENERFQRDSSIIFADIDLARLSALRRNESSLGDNDNTCEKRFVTVQLHTVPPTPDLSFAKITPLPFVPQQPKVRDVRCREILDIQCAGLAKRLEHVNAAKAVIGISGGLDSTLALLVCAKTMGLLKRPTSDILAVSMPGLGTSARTNRNARRIIDLLGAELLEIPIKQACLQHFKDIGHDPATHDTTFENVQARERTQILMDLANRHRGLVIGTGDLSEIALGWSTYAGDHISMYGVNCSVPKTLVRYLINYEAAHAKDVLRKVLEDIIATPVSPELLPGNNGKIEQKTEDIIGPYELHDFFLYHTIKYGATPDKIKFLANIAFSDIHAPKTIEKYLKLFLERFFHQQFKRSCIPDGPKIGAISLSPRGDWRMPSDASSAIWLTENNIR